MSTIEVAADRQHEHPIRPHGSALRNKIFGIFRVGHGAGSAHGAAPEVPTRRATRRVGALFKPFSTRQCLKPIALKNASASALLSFTVTRIVAL